MAERRPPTSRIGRSARIGALVAGQGARAAGGRITDRGRDEEGRREAQSRRYAKIAEEVVDQLGRMKGAAMKFGQVLSTVDLPNLDPEDRERLKEKLAVLRDQAPRVAFKDVERVMREDWGEPPSRVLAELDPEAVAAASIGQVYRGVTKDGRDVAIKVQYPGIVEAVDADLRAARALVPLIKRLSPGLDGKALVDELRERVSEELDYELEAQNGRRVARHWRDHPHVLVPRVDTELSTRRVLVSDWVDGDGFAVMKAARGRRARPPGRDDLPLLLRQRARDGPRARRPAPRQPHAQQGRRAARRAGLRARPLAGRRLRRSGGAHLPGARRAGRGAIAASFRELGYLKGAVDEELLKRYMLLTGEWMWDLEQPFRLSGDYAADLAERAMGLGPEWLTMVRGFDIPPEALLLRRMENMVFSTLCDLRAAADWQALAEELRAGLEPQTQLGREHASWRVS